MKLSGIQSYVGLRQSFAADFADQSCKHQFDLADSSFERVVLTWRQELKVSRKKKEIIQFARRAKRDVKVVLQLRPSRPATALRNVRRNGEGGASHLTSEPVSFRFRKRTSCAINAESHSVTLLPDHEFTKVLHAFASLAFGFTYNLILITYNWPRGVVQC